MTPYGHDNSMMADAVAHALPRRVSNLERRVDGHEQSIVKLQIGEATFVEQIGGLKDSNYALKATMDKLLWALIGLLVTVAGSATIVVLNVSHH